MATGVLVSVAGFTGSNQVLPRDLSQNPFKTSQLQYQLIALIRCLQPDAEPGDSPGLGGKLPSDVPGAAPLGCGEFQRPESLCAERNELGSQSPEFP